jgi:hypothetical protein
MDYDRAIHCGDSDVSVDIIAGVLGQWRYYRAACREVAKKRRVSCPEDREGHVLRIRRARLDFGDLVRDCELMILSVSRWRGERGKQGYCRRDDEREAQM